MWKKLRGATERMEEILESLTSCGSLKFLLCCHLLSHMDHGASTCPPEDMHCNVSLLVLHFHIYITHIYHISCS